MLRWCSYCQHFLGHAAPFENHSVTHGICPSCVDSKSFDSFENIQKMREIGEFFRNIQDAVMSGVMPQTGPLLDEAQLLGIRPADLLMGMIQPLLLEIAEKQSRGEASIGHEHLLSSFADSLTHLITEKYGLPSLFGNKKAQVLLSCVQGNYHYLGVRFLDIFLKQRGIDSVAFYPSLPAEEIVSLARRLQVRAIGLSVALAPQLDEVRLVESLLTKEEESLQIFLGGPLFFSHGSTPELLKGIRAEVVDVSQLELFAERLKDAVSLNKAS